MNWLMLLGVKLPRAVFARSRSMYKSPSTSCGISTTKLTTSPSNPAIQQSFGLEISTTLLKHILFQ
jgi:hypothetical protein